MSKSYRNISTEFEFQINSMLGYLDQDLLRTDESWAAKGKLSYQKARDFESQLQNLKSKFSDQTRLTSIQFSQNLLREYDSGSGKQLSKTQLGIALESRANRILRSLLAQENTDLQLLGHLKEFLNSCLCYGLNLTLEEDEYEINFNAQE